MAFRLKSALSNDAPFQKILFLAYQRFYPLCYDLFLIRHSIRMNYQFTTLIICD